MRGALEALQGVVSVEIDKITKEVTVLYWPDQVSGDDMLEAVDAVGYPGEIIGGDCQ